MSAKTLYVSPLVEEWTRKQIQERESWVRSVCSEEYLSRAPSKPLPVAALKALETIVSADPGVSPLPLSDNVFRAGGYAVRFSGKDFAGYNGQFYTPDTDFGELGTIPVHYRHGFDPAIGTRQIGTGKAHADEYGLWFEMQLQVRDEYERAIVELVKGEQLSMSSGTAPGSADMIFNTGWTKEVTRWPIKEVSIAPATAGLFTHLRPIEAYNGRGRF